VGSAEMLGRDLEQRFLVLDTPELKSEFDCFCLMPNLNRVDSPL
jgi:hypothetical protein